MDKTFLSCTSCFTTKVDRQQLNKQATTFLQHSMKTMYNSIVDNVLCLHIYVEMSSDLEFSLNSFYDIFLAMVH